MLYSVCYGACFGCGRLFSFNYRKVPSILFEGECEPVCANCVARANPERIKRGLEPIVPLPGAYEPEPEEGEYY